MSAFHPYFKSNSDMFQLQVKQTKVMTTRLRNYHQAKYEVSIKTRGDNQCFEYLGLRSDFGPELKSFINQEIYMLSEGNNVFGCEPYSKKEMVSIRGKILLVNRGQCEFIDKVMYAQEAGAKAVLFLNNNQQQQSTFQTGLIGSTIEDDSFIRIPSLMISYYDAISLLNSNRKQPILLDLVQLPSIDNDPNAIISLFYRGERIKNIVIINL